MAPLDVAENLIDGVVVDGLFTVACAAGKAEQCLVD